MPGETGVTVVTTLVCFFIFAREAAGATSARHSLRPHSRRRIHAQLGRIASRGYERVSGIGCLKSESVRIDAPYSKAVIARLDRAIQYSEAPVIEPRSRGVLGSELINPSASTIRY
jgi:hypothetical protein